MLKEAHSRPLEPLDSPGLTRNKKSRPVGRSSATTRAPSPRWCRWSPRTPLPGGSESYLPTTVGHKFLTKYFAGPQELLITKSRGYKRYADRHAICSNKRRNVDDRHVKPLCQVSKRRSVITQINALAVHMVLKCARPMSESPSGASSAALGVSMTE